MENQDNLVVGESEAWSFIRNEANSWTWHHSINGKDAKHSESAFETIQECEADAIKNGKPNYPYVPTATES